MIHFNPMMSKNSPPTASPAFPAAALIRLLSRRPIIVITPENIPKLITAIDLSIPSTPSDSPVEKLSMLTPNANRTIPIPDGLSCSSFLKNESIICSPVITRTKPPAETRISPNLPCKKLPAVMLAAGRRICILPTAALSWSLSHNPIRLIPIANAAPNASADSANDKIKISMLIYMQSDIFYTPCTGGMTRMSDVFGFWFSLFRYTK